MPCLSLRVIWGTWMPMKPRPWLGVRLPHPGLEHGVVRGRERQRGDDHQAQGLPGHVHPLPEAGQAQQGRVGGVPEALQHDVRVMPSPCTKKVMPGRAASSRGRKAASILRLVKSTRARPRQARISRSMA